MTEQDFERIVITLTADEQAGLERLSEQDTDDDVAVRAEIIQWYAMGQSTEQIVRASGVEPEMAVFWKAKFLEYGIDGIVRGPLTRSGAA